MDTIQRNILDDTDGILEFLNDINAKAPRNSKFICDEISSQGMTQGLGILEFHLSYILFFTFLLGILDFYLAITS